MDPATMDSEIAAEYPPMLRVYKNGRIERLIGNDIVPASLDPQNGVLSKDVVYSPENNLSVRLFLPHKALETAGKLPLLVYFHGGGFIIESAFSPTYHNFLTEVVAAADCLAVSVDYRRAPEHPIPAPYEDSWAALKWVFTHSGGNGPEDWLNKYADLRRVFLAGDSAGANIAHHMGMRVGKEKLKPEGNSVIADKGSSGIEGIILVHPFFWGKEPVDEHETKDEGVRSIVEAIWAIASSNSVDGADDPWINVVRNGSDLSGLGCGRVLVLVAGKDALVRQGLAYAAKLEKSGWGGVVEAVEAKDEEHVFHLMNPKCENALEMMKKFVGFVKA